MSPTRMAPNATPAMRHAIASSRVSMPTSAPAVAPAAGAVTTRICASSSIVPVSTASTAIASGAPGRAVLSQTAKPERSWPPPPDSPCGSTAHRTGDPPSSVTPVT
jgi:hypothetical protein